MNNLHQPPPPDRAKAPPHTHRWIQYTRDVVSMDAEHGLVTTRYEHECPVCGKRKVTVRANRTLPPETKWTRELEKLMERAEADGYTYAHAGQPLVITLVEVKKHV